LFSSAYKFLATLVAYLAKDRPHIAIFADQNIMVVVHPEERGREQRPQAEPEETRRDRTTEFLRFLSPHAVPETDPDRGQDGLKMNAHFNTNAEQGKREYDNRAWRSMMCQRFSPSRDCKCTLFPLVHSNN